MQDARQAPEWMRKYNWPKSEKPSGAQRKRAMFESRIVKVTHPKKDQNERESDRSDT